MCQTIARRARQRSQCAGWHLRLSCHHLRHFSSLHAESRERHHHGQVGRLVHGHRAVGDQHVWGLAVCDEAQDAASQHIVCRYPGLNNTQVCALVAGGGTMSAPKHCQIDWYARISSLLLSLISIPRYPIMQQCWALEPQMRPDFIDVLKALKSLGSSVIDSKCSCSCRSRHEGAVR